MVRRLQGLVLLITLFCTLPATAAPTETAKKPQENDYELYKILVDTVDQVDAITSPRSIGGS